VIDTSSRRELGVVRKEQNCHKQKQQQQQQQQQLQHPSSIINSRNKALKLTVSGAV